ncbi:hypothetical protein P171DRAFT_20391 [Karstenula rhodostoma CBS 690.94]|uniref:Uncharacterized protein n=1 Tax=Karstenula rhodostoma CBS 690.94 TaxID=1392251 RepID=A0A9P4PX92_9PLEO|nr:hypothetical protein P171DRAFT_20391 [Karstenula rhodostoma CBS 690.94]
MSGLLLFFFFFAAVMATAVCVVSTLYLLLDFDFDFDFNFDNIKTQGGELLRSFVSNITNVVKFLPSSTSTSMSINRPLPTKIATTTTTTSTSKDEHNTITALPVSHGPTSAASKLLRQTRARTLHARAPGIVQLPTGGYNCAVM